MALWRYLDCDEYLLCGIVCKQKARLKRAGALFGLKKYEVLLPAGVKLNVYVQTAAAAAPVAPAAAVPVLTSLFPLE